MLFLVMQRPSDTVSSNATMVGGRDGTVVLRDFCDVVVGRGARLLLRVESERLRKHEDVSTSMLVIDHLRRVFAHCLGLETLPTVVVAGSPRGEWNLVLEDCHVFGHACHVGDVLVLRAVRV